MRFLTALVALGLIASAPAQAAFLKKILIVIPYGPGGGFDTLTHASPYIEEYFREKSGKSFNKIKVVPKNMPGASGKKAAVYTSKQKPDGYTVQMLISQATDYLILKEKILAMILRATAG